MPLTAIRVASPPPLPVLLFDADCRLCARWAESVRADLRGLVDLEPLQSAGARFPEISPGELLRAIHLVEPDGRVCSGAAAILRALTASPDLRWLRGLVERVPGFPTVAEAVYDRVAANRALLSRIFLPPEG